MRLKISAPIVEWRGPAPFYWAEVDPEGCAEIASIAAMITYGWGVIPVTVHLGKTVFTTSIMPRNGGYLVPIKADVRKAERVELGDVVALTLEFAI